MKIPTKQEMRKINRKYRRNKFRYWFNNHGTLIYVVIIFLTFVIMLIAIILSTLF